MMFSKLSYSLKQPLPALLLSPGGTLLGCLIISQVTLKTSTQETPRYSK